MRSAAVDPPAGASSSGSQQDVGEPVHIGAKQLYRGLEWQFLVFYTSGLRAWHDREGKLLEVVSTTWASASPIAAIDPALMESMVSEFGMTSRVNLKTLRFGAMGFAIPIVTYRPSRLSIFQRSMRRSLDLSNGPGTEQASGGSKSSSKSSMSSPVDYAPRTSVEEVRALAGDAAQPTAEAGTSDTSRAQSADETTDESLPERGQGGVGNALLTVPEGTAPTQQG